MPVLGKIRRKFSKEQPFVDLNITTCMHVTAETANLVLTLRDGGANLSVCASNPLTTQEDVVRSLQNEYGVSVYAIRGGDNEVYYDNIRKALDHNPAIVVDDGADLVTMILQERYTSISKMIGGTEETTTGVLRLCNMEKAGVLPFPVVAVNNAKTKNLFDNRYGTGQSTLDGIIRATNILISGMKIVVAGYGWCGRGIAMRARGLGANVIVTEVDPIRALEAVMDGYRVVSMLEAASIGDIFVTATGNEGVIRQEHFQIMQSGAIIANAGHFNVEIDLSALREITTNRREVRPLVEEYQINEEKKIYLLAEGRLVNLACAEGHPSSVMDMSFANQALAVLYLLNHGRKMEKKVYGVSEEVDRQIASWKLESMGIKIDNLTKDQIKYLTDWSQGT